MTGDRIKWTALACGSAFLLATSGASAGGWGGGGGLKYEASSTFSIDKGKMTVPLYQGAAMPFEITVIPGIEGNECDEMVTELKWDRDDNKMKVKLKGKNVLDPNPSIDRTAGVNFYPDNPFWPEPEDIVDGRYQFWLISAGGGVTLYYDPVTLDLLGSQYDFATPPPAIPVTLPSFKVVSTTPFEPKANGDVNMSWEWDYDRVVKLDQQDSANPGHHIATFPPHNLCLANPFRYDLSTTEAYITPGLPEEFIQGWDEWLENGMIFDLTVEPDEYYTIPPLTTQVATYSGGAIFGGAIPQGMQMDIGNIFDGLAPAISEWPSRDTCEPYFYAPPRTGINWCPPGM